MCGCPPGKICSRETGSCFESALPTTINVVTPGDGEEFGPSARFIYINGTVTNLPQGASLSIDDQRFYLRSFDAATGTFSFVNKSVLPPGPTAVSILLRDAKGAVIASTHRSFSVLSAGAQPKGMQLELLAFTAILVLLALLILHFGQRTLFLVPKQAFALSMQRGDVVLVEGPIGSRKEEFCLSLAKREIGKGKRVAIASFAPEREKALFSEAERRNIIEKRLEPEINEMALMVSEILESKPDLVYFNIFHGLYPKYTAKELSSFVEATIKKLKNAGATAFFVLDKDIFSQQELSMLESLFDGVIEFDVRALPGKVKIFCRVKEFKLRSFNPDWIEYA
jgi:KaiC/GvpD/RAD55 family RecA-like ATPase